MNENNHVRLSLWPKEEFSSAEMVQLTGYLSQPVVKKYLLHCGALTMESLAVGGLKPGQTIESYMLAQCQVQGGLDVLNQLLAFEYPVESEQPDDNL